MHVATTNLDEGVDCENAQVGMCFGVVPGEPSAWLENEYVLIQRTHMRYRYTSFFWSKSEVAIFFNRSGNRAETSFPSVIAAIVFLMASFLYIRQQAILRGAERPPYLSWANCELRPVLSSQVSPFRGVTGNMFLILFAAMVGKQGWRSAVGSGDGLYYGRAVARRGWWGAGQLDVSWRIER